MATEVKIKRKRRLKLHNDVFVVTLLSILMGLVVGALVLALSGFNPGEAYSTMFNGVFSKPKYIAQTIVFSMPLMLTGLSVAFAFRTGLFNIGAEGQYIVGAVTAAYVGYAVHAPAIIHIPLVIFCAGLAGGLYGALAGYLKARFGINEVISTIMLNWVAFYVSNFIVRLPGIQSTGSESTFDIQDTAKISIDWMKSLVGNSVKVNWGILLALVIAGLVYYYLFRTVQGFELRAVGFNAEAARYAGIDVNKCIIKSMFISGVLSGLAGAVQICGVAFHVSSLAVMEGYGMNGISVALIGSNSPFGVVLAALLFAGLNYGGTKMQTLQIPGEVVSIVIGAIIFFIAIAQVFRFVTKYLNKITTEEE